MRSRTGTFQNFLIRDATRSRGLAVYAITRPELVVAARHDWRRPASLCVHVDILFQGRQATGGAASGRAEERQVNTGKSDLSDISL